MIEVKELQVSCLMTQSISIEFVKEKYFTCKLSKLLGHRREGGQNEYTFSFLFFCSS